MIGIVLIQWYWEGAYLLVGNRYKYGWIVFVMVLLGWWYIRGGSRGGGALVAEVPPLHI